MALREIAVDKIEIGERFRQEYDIDDLIDSVRDKGIIQPITVRTISKGRYELVAGGRRLTAAKELQLPKVPALVRDSDGELDLREIEYIENHHRKDMTWQERMDLVARIHTLMEEKDPKWSERKTAQMLEKSVGGINRLSQLRTMCEKFPKLREERTEDDAVKKARKLLEAVTVAALSKRFEEGETNDGGAETIDSGTDSRKRSQSDPFLSRARHASSHFQIGDAFEGMREIIEDPDLSSPIALVEVDPPYGIDLKKAKKGEKDKKLNIYEEIEKDQYEMWTRNLIDCLYEVTPKDCRVIYWFGIEWYGMVYSNLIERGFSVDPIPGIWVKPAGQTNSPELYLARSWEPFFIATKGQGIPIRERGRRNVFEFTGVPAPRKYHPTQRPVELMREILRTFAWPGSVILVPFLGSGATLRAAYQEGINGFGWELNKENKKPFLAAIQEDIDAYQEKANEDSDSKLDDIDIL